MRRMTNNNSDMRATSRRQRARSRSPPRAESSRRQRRSRSPTRGHEYQADRREKSAKDSSRHIKTEVFQSGAGPRGGVCAVCLGRHEHAFTKCDNTKLWDGSPCASRRNEQGRLVAANGLSLCFDWQVPKGCKSSGHLERHLCSGCGGADHGAQGCPRAERP